MYNIYLLKVLLLLYLLAAACVTVC